MSYSFGKISQINFFKKEMHPILNFLWDEHQSNYISFMNNNEDRKNRRLHGSAHILVNKTIKNEVSENFYYYVTKSIYKRQNTKQVEVKDGECSFMYSEDCASIRRDLLKQVGADCLRFLIVAEDFIYSATFKEISKFDRKSNIIENQSHQECILVPLECLTKHIKNKVPGNHGYDYNMWKPECIGNTKYNTTRNMGLYKIQISKNNEVKWEAQDYSAKACIKKVVPILQRSGIKCSVNTLQNRYTKGEPFVVERDGDIYSISVYSLSPSTQSL